MVGVAVVGGGEVIVVMAGIMGVVGVVVGVIAVVGMVIVVVVANPPIAHHPLPLTLHHSDDTAPHP